MTSDLPGQVRHQSILSAAADHGVVSMMRAMCACVRLSASYCLRVMGSPPPCNSCAARERSHRR